MTILDGGYGPAYWVAGRNKDTGSHILKAAVYNSSSSVPFQLSFKGVGSAAQGKLTYLTAPMNASNSIGVNVVREHHTSVHADRRGRFCFELPPYSVGILEVEGSMAGRGYDYRDANSRRHWKGWRN